jgi:hypothetical protein
MQVAHQKDHITHAIIGGSQPIEFGISSSAEFFNILSSTLYKDQILAVVREVLCNAWDAHIEAGYTDKPVEVTITDDKFIIKDFGRGIHKDDMGLIYGTYGNSTKKNDGQQTGGFGLGCKAPFAYTDHFEVISCHDGVKTIYNLSKSSAQAMGKPGIIPIASFPTTDTGLQVTIRILNNMNRNRFMRLVQRIAKNGDMNVLFNGKQVETLGFDTTKANYLIAPGEFIENQTDIMVRYGNVIYPVDTASEIGHEYKIIKAHLEALGRHSRNYNIIFQAPPHSISVTPSRESLSMQEHTIKTLKMLLGGFVDTLNTTFKEACSEFAQAAVENAVADKRIADLLTTAECLPIKGDSTHPTHISDLLTMSQRYMESNYPKSLDFRKQDIKFRLEKMVVAGLLQRGTVQTFLRHLDKVKAGFQRGHEPNDWLQRCVVGPLVVKLIKAGIDHKKLYVFDSGDANAPSNSYDTSTPPMVAFNMVAPRHLFATLPYLRNIVVLTKSRRDLKLRIFRHDVFKQLGKYEGFLVYHVGMKKAEQEAALTFFQASGMTVVDLTTRQDWEEEPEKRDYSARKPVQKGLACLKSVVPAKNVRMHINTTLSRLDTAPRIENPEFLVEVKINKTTSTLVLDHWDELASFYIVELFGDKGGITTNSSMHAKWKGKNIPEMTDYVRQKVCDYMLNSPTIREYWAFDVNRALTTYYSDCFYNTSVIEMVYNTEILRQEFGLVNNLTEEDRKYVHLWKDLISHHRYNIPPDMASVRTYLNAIPLDPANALFIKKVKDSELLSILDKSGLARLLNSSDTSPQLAKAAIDVLALVLKN